MDKSSLWKVTQKLEVMLKSVPIRDGNLFQGIIGEKMKQGLLVMHLAIPIVV